MKENGERKKGQKRKVDEIPPHELEIRTMNRIRTLLMDVKDPGLRARIVRWVAEASFDDSRGPAKVHRPDPRQLDNDVDGNAKQYQIPGTGPAKNQPSAADTWED